MTMRLKNVENFSITATSESRIIVSWEKGDRRYHVWYIDGLENTLFSNPKTTGRSSRRDTRKLDFLSHTHATMREDVLAALTPNARRDAFVAFDEAEAAKEEAELAGRHARRLERLNTLLESGDLNAEATDVVMQLRSLTRSQFLLIL